MASELAYVLINPYTIAKSRTGGVIARFIGRTDLNFIAARMFGPCTHLAEQYAELVKTTDPDQKAVCDLISDYIVRNYSPDPVTGRVRRVLMLLFEGEDAVEKIWSTTGGVTLKRGSGETVRDTYGDYIEDPSGSVRYFEPAVFVAPTKKRAEKVLKLWASYSESCGGIIDTAADFSTCQQTEKTLVMLKPDNFRFPSARPGNIIDILSLSGLRIIAAKRFNMSVSQAEEFYGPVKTVLRNKFRDIGFSRVAQALSREFGISPPVEVLNNICDNLAPSFAEDQFSSIVHFMTGRRVSDCEPECKEQPGTEGCLALVYGGPSAVEKIRTILGPTDPNKARPGSVRREFGSNIMINAAHASDSIENAEREMRIIRVQEDTIATHVERYYGKLERRSCR